MNTITRIPRSKAIQTQALTYHTTPNKNKSEKTKHKRKLYRILMEEYIANSGRLGNYTISFSQLPSFLNLTPRQTNELYRKTRS